MPKFSKTKILLVSLLTLLVFTSLFTSPAQAAKTRIQDVDGNIYLINNESTDSAAKTYISGDGSVYYDKNTQELTKSVDGNMISALLSGLKNEIIPQPLLIRDSETGEPLTSASGQYLYINQPGALDTVMSFNQQMYHNPPASGIVYAQQEWEKITTGHVAHAQTEGEASWIYYPGLGYNILKPIQAFWTITRNIAYLALILIIIIIAFMVAFRSNLGGQTQVTIANSIPNIIVALIMITLSYPLSGLAIDMITVGSNLVQQVLVQNSWSPGYKDVWAPTTLDKFGFEIKNVKEFGGTFGTEEDPARNHLQIDDPAMSAWEIFITSNVDIINADTKSVIPQTNVLGGVVTKVLTGMLDNGFTGVFIQLMFAIAALSTSVKLFLKFLTKYLVLVLYPIISPFIMLTVAIPGQGAKAIFGYFKTLLSASLSFVAVYAVFLLMIVITHHTEFMNGLKFLPPLLGYSSAVLDSTETSQISVVQMILAFGLFMTTPVIPDALDQALNVLPAYADRLTPGQRTTRALVGGAPFMGLPTGLAGGFGGASAVVGKFTQPFGPKKPSK